MSDPGIIVPGGPSSVNIVNTTGVTTYIDPSLSPYNADKTGAVDSTAAISAAISAAIAANGKVSVFLPAGTFKMNNQIVKTGLTSSQSMQIQGVPGATIIDATASTDATVFDLEGALGSGRTLSSAVTKGDTTVSIVDNPDGIAVGDYIRISTATYANARASFSTTVNTGTPGTVTGVSGGNWNNGDLIAVSNNSSYPIIPGTTVASGGGTGTLTLSSNVTVGAAGATIYHPDTTFLWTPDLFQAYRGEIARVTSVTGSGPFVIGISLHAQDNYSTTSALVYKLSMPRIVMSGLTIKRNAVKVGVLIQYAKDMDISFNAVTGARDYGILTEYCYGGRVHDNHITDVYDVTGNSYCLTDFSSHYVRFDHNFLEECRGGVNIGGTDPVRFAIIDHNYIAIKETATLTLGGVNIHENSEHIYVDDNEIMNGGVSVAVGGGAGAWVRRNTIQGNLTSQGSLVSGFVYNTLDNLVIEGNVGYATGNWPAQGINVQWYWVNTTLDNLVIKNNTMRAAGTKSVQVQLIPNNDVLTGNVVNRFYFDDNDVADNSLSAPFRLLGSSGDVGPAYIKINEAWIRRNRLEALNGGTQNFVFEYNPDTGSGPIHFEDNLFRTARSPNGGFLVQINLLNGTRHTVSDVTFRGGVYDGGGGSSGALGLFFNSGITSLMDLEMRNMGSRSGFYPDLASGLTGTTNYYLKNVRLTNVSGAFTPPTGVQLIEDRGMGQTANVVGDWASNTGWGATTHVITAVSGFDSNGTVSIQGTGAVAANPTLTLTFKQPFKVAPQSAQITQIGGPAWTALTGALPSVALTTTTMVLTFNATPTITSTYVFGYKIV